jgi:hypothetical protein
LLLLVVKKQVILLYLNKIEYHINKYKNHNYKFKDYLLKIMLFNYFGDILLIILLKNLFIFNSLLIFISLIHFKYYLFNIIMENNNNHNLCI